MSKKILVVDDSRTEALKARLLLEREGYQVTLAVDGRDGLVKAAQEQPDLILLDTLMPNMNGFEACGRLKIDPRTQHIPIVLTPAGAEAADMPSGAGLDVFLIKPYDPKALAAKVAAMLDHSVVSGDQAELQHLRKQLAAAQKARSDFLANMSHELRTPLHEIIGMTDLLTGTDPTDEQTEYLNTVRISSNALLNLISDVIEFSELEAGQLGLQNKEFHLLEPTEHVVEIMGARALEKGLKLETSFSHQVPRVLVGDASRLRQVLSNLIANAIKFTEHGEVTLRVDLEAVHDQDVELHFRVSDTGIGIPADRLELIFEPFQQADSSATRCYGGLGMGLAMAKQLVKLMGGQMWAESRVGGGSIFHFRVKMTMPAARAEQLAAVGTQNWPHSLRILVAEDSPTNQLIASSSLKKAGHTVTLAVNGVEAVKAFEQSRASHAPFDLILMDISMPGMDGLEATESIREKEKTLGGHVPIVAMTAFATKEYHAKCLAAGMDAYVTKPVRIDELNQALESLFVNRDQASDIKGQSSEMGNPGLTVDLREALEVVGGDVDILRDAVALSLEEIPGELNALKAALSQSDAKQVEAKAHRLKGIMGSLGGLIAHEIGQRLEAMGEQGRLVDGRESLISFEREIERVVAFYHNPHWEGLARQLAMAVIGDP